METLSKFSSLLKKKIITPLHKFKNFVSLYNVTKDIFVKCYFFYKQYSYKFISKVDSELKSKREILCRKDYNNVNYVFIQE